MSSSVSSLRPQTERASATTPAKPADAAPAKSSGSGGIASPQGKLDKACHDFEGVLLRQLLTVSKVGEQAGSGYGGMVIDALSSAIEGAGGLGLSEQIRAALEPRAAKKMTEAASSFSGLGPSKSETKPRAVDADHTSQTENAASPARLGLVLEGVST